MDNVKSHLEILSEDANGKVNYESWRFKLNLTLKTRGLYEIAIGEKVKPEGGAADAAVVAWVKSDLDAQALIGLNVDSNIARKLTTCTNARTMIERLENLYGRRSESAIEGLQRRFFSYVYDDSKSVVANCMELQQLVDELSTTQEAIRPSWMMTRILGMLPDKLKHFRTAWDNAPAADKTMDNLLERLRLEEDRLDQASQDNASSGVNAFLSRTGTHGPHHREPGGLHSGNKSANVSFNCFRCGLKGHTKRNCRNKPCAQYLQYCKENYNCNTCGAKGHFAKDCTKKPEDKRNHGTGDKNDNRQSRRRALLTVGLSTANLDQLNSQRDALNHWYQDCAASQHMTSHRQWFTNYRQLQPLQEVIIGDSTRLQAIGTGTVELEAFNGKEWYQVDLVNVLHVPKLNFNLFSVSQTLDRNYVQTANKKTSIFKTAEDGEIVAMAERDGNMFKMLLRRAAPDTCLLTESVKVWHERLAHQNVRYVRDILDRHGVKYVDDWHGHVCEGCTLGKQHRVSHPPNPQVASRQLDLVHVDLCEMGQTSLGGAKYFLLFKDDFSHYRTAYFLKKKDEAPQKLQLYLRMTQTQFGRPVKRLHSDNGTEIKNALTRKMLEDQGIRHTFSNAYTPEQNGRVEREMRTVVEAARSALHARNLEPQLWAEAVNYVIFTLNQTGTSTQKGKSPAELWFGRRMDISKLQTFGIDCFVLTPSHKRTKLGPKSKKGIFVGYDVDSPCYRVYLTEERDTVCSDNVRFGMEAADSPRTEVQGTYLEGPAATRPDLEDTDEEDNGDPDDQDQEEEPLMTSDEEEEPQPRRPGLRNRRELQPPARYSDYVMGYFRRDHTANAAVVSEAEDIPVAAALHDQKWRQAMTDEINALKKMDTWRLVRCPPNVRPLTCKWVLKKKVDGKCKARLVARGFEQKEGLDYAETFSPVARHTSIRFILSLAASENLKLVPFDVTSAFLHGDLEEELYMQQPEGFEDGSNLVCRLQKSLYGLKQAPRKWNEKIAGLLEQMGLQTTDDDPCVYYNARKTLLLTLFVDDGLIAGQDVQEIFCALRQINKHFHITYSTEVPKKFSYIGMDIAVGPAGIFVGQSRYCQKVLRRFGSDACNPVSTPIEKGMTTTVNCLVNDKPADATIPYREVVGSLLYLATISRPDISFSVNYLSRYCSRPMVSHWKMAKRVLQYLKGTADMGIHFNGDAEFKAYSDSDYAGDSESGHSTSGVLILRGGPIVWCTQKQRLVATSTAEAEYRAAVSAINEVSWLRRLACELEVIPAHEPIPLLVDNKSAIHMLHSAHEGKTTKGKKHIEIPRKFIQQHVGETVSLEHVASPNQLADILTKPLTRKTFENLRCEIVKEECRG